MDLLAINLAEKRRNLKMTILHRPGGIWHHSEVAKLVQGLTTEVSQHPKHPEHVVLFGHYTKEQTLKAIGGGIAYTATQVTGIQDERLPFIPGFA